MGLIVHHTDSSKITSADNSRALRAAPQHSPVPPRRVSPLREGPRVRRRGLYLGTSPDGQAVYLSPKHLRTHLHILGPTGQGKSRLLLWLFQLLCHTGRPIVLVDPKGDLYHQALNWTLSNGFGQRLVLFDLASDILPGYNPLRQNGLRIDLQVQWAREGVKSAWGANTFDTTPLLARMLFLTLYVARAMALSLMEALNVLRPSPTLRHAAIKKITDPFVRGSLVAFDQLSDRIKAEQASSTLSRLEMFLCDTTIRQVICSSFSIDPGQVLAERKIWLIKAAKYQPVLADPLKLLLRFLGNDILANVYKGHGEGRFNENNPVFFMADEAQDVLSSPWAAALDQGRGIGLHCVLAHQHLSQLVDEDQSVSLLRSFMNDARTKIVFGGLDSQDVQAFADNLLLAHYDPLRVKHILRTPFLAPVESVRKVPTWSTSTATNQSATDSTSDSDSMSHSVEHSVSHGRTLGDSFAETEGVSESSTQGRNSSVTESHNWGTAENRSGARTRSRAHTTGTAVGRGRSHGQSSSKGSTDSFGTSTASGWSAGEGSTDSYGRSSASGWSLGDGTHTTAGTGEGQMMSPPDEGVFVSADPELIGISTHTGTTAGHTTSAGTNHLDAVSSGHADSRMRTTNHMDGSSTGHAKSRMQAINDNESENFSFSTAATDGVSDTEGWSTGSHADHGIAHQTGESEAWTRGTNRSTTRGTTVTNSSSITDGLSNSVGKTYTRGKSLTEGETITNGESVALTPFYEYVREEIETPIFLTPEEQKLLMMQRLANIPKQYFLVTTPDSPDCVVRAPYVPDPAITKRRLAAGLESVYSALPCYTHVEPCGADEVIDVAVRQVPEAHATQISKALPSPAPDEEPIFWQDTPATSRGSRQ